MTNFAASMASVYLCSISMFGLNMYCVGIDAGHDYCTQNKLCRHTKHAVNAVGKYCMRQTICFSLITARQYLSEVLCQGLTLEQMTCHKSIQTNTLQ